jgi:plastocyanin
LISPTVLSWTCKSFGIFALLAVSLVCGCGREETADTRAAQSGSGVIQGRVVFSGAAPAMKIIPGSPMVNDESIVVGPNNGLKNVIVFLKDAPKPTFVLNTPAVLDQVKCVYVPHVLAVQTGQTLRLKSSDALMHNVHLKCQVNPDANYGFPGVGQRDITLASAEPPFPVRCDVHPWMSAWIGVFDHPWFAVTGDDGRFTIEHVPPGKYTLVAWQEVLPQQQQQINVAATGTTEADFTFQSP